MRPLVVWHRLVHVSDQHDCVGVLVDIWYHDIPSSIYNRETKRMMLLKNLTIGTDSGFVQSVGQNRLTG